MEELETDTARGIQTCSAADLTTGNYITGGMTVIITGPAGTGKSYFACVLGDRACRNGRKALILASQLPVADWYDVFQSELIAEACLDRIVHKAIKFDLKGESLRKKY